MTDPDATLENPLPTTTPSVRGALLGIDHGKKVLGIAICDALWIAARPLGIIRRTQREIDFGHLLLLIEENNIAGIVVGLPENPEMARGNINQADTVRRWASRLAAIMPIPVWLWDEQFSSLEAQRLADEAGLPDQERIDDRAAAVILQSFIDAHMNGAEPPAPIKQR